jgi:hypothetical protein
VKDLDLELRCTEEDEESSSKSLLMQPRYVFILRLLNDPRSSYDPAVRLLAGPGYHGPVCLEGHRLKTRLYKRAGRHCDRCEQDLVAGSSGQHCKVRAAGCLDYSYSLQTEGLRFRLVRHLL